MKITFTFSQWQPKYWLSFHIILIFAKIWKTNKVRLTVGEQKYIYTTEIKLKKKNQRENIFFWNPKTNLKTSLAYYEKVV